ncbi:IMPACT family protein [Fulvivirga sedimenti]|uniref:YigZ family protein n=1 Tax=Fulvivirga sedimenti TaxID=2879465 RepID=A0A9X1KWJ7_9BACT|nr:YigZ family protein [Fulvivirga sedimenti]MCA6074029.1 YigZ family protein [Fulvivirga sedimenti]
MDAPVTYRTIESPSYGEYREKGSKFFAFAYPVENDQDIRKFQDELRAQFHDARHHCYAWVLGHNGEQYRANDDGEPTHSAGDPILGQIRSENITEVLIVVVRYFGGTKLGIGGLVNAYKTAAARALLNSKIIEKEVTDGVHITYSYDATSEVMRLIDSMSARITDQTFTDVCSVDVRVNISFVDQFLEQVNLLKKMGHEVDVSAT